MNVDDLEKTSLVDDVFNTIIGGCDLDPDDEESKEPEMDSGKESSKTNVDPQSAVQDDKCITYCDRLLELLYQIHGLKCKVSSCGKRLDYRKTFSGTCFIVSWRCSSGHFGGRWSSQPKCEGLRAGNLLLASAIALSGNSFTKVGFLFRIMNLKYFSQSLFNQYQNLYIAPAVDKYWKSMKSSLWDEREGQDILLSSDGRSDSPGHCAQYCTYSFADMEAQTILNMNIVDVREVEGRKSPNMERIGFERGLDEILTSKMVIKEVVTDGHLEIGALMSMLL
jgi:hypothetical protein